LTNSFGDVINNELSIRKKDNFAFNISILNIKDEKEIVYISPRIMTKDRQYYENKKQLV